MKIYRVGGSVRDYLLGYDNVDNDWVVVGTTAQTMMQQGFIPVGKDFPVFLHPDSKEEYALARTERKISKGYYGFAYHTSPNITLEEDLARRDLTINAIAQSIDGQIIDPYGGQQDLKNKILRHTSAAFTEDPVRILRISRFAARFYDFNISKKTLKLMKYMVDNGEVDSLVPERVWKEMLRALQENHPDKFFLTLRKCGALSKIFPELDNLWGIPHIQIQNNLEIVDTGTHIMMALREAVKLSLQPIVRFAVLCHDLGKSLTLKKEIPNHNGYEFRGVKLIKEWCNKYRVPNKYKDLAVKVARWHMQGHNVYKLSPKDILYLFKSINAFKNPSILYNYCLACTADFKGYKMQKSNYYQSDILQYAFVLAKEVKSQQFIDQGLTGIELGMAIDEARIIAIHEFLLNYDFDKHITT